MNEQNTYCGIMLQRYFDRFKSLVYRDVPISKFLYYQFCGFIVKNWSYEWAKSNLPYFQDAVSRFQEADLYSWSDEPYPYDPHPDGVVLMRSGFVDIASKHLPKERYFLISHTQTEVNLIQSNLPDQPAHSIDEYFRENPLMVHNLNQQVAEIIHEQKDDPILGSPKLLQWFQGNMNKVVQIFDAVQTLFEQLNISAVLTISAINWMESALNLFAKAHRIPSFTGQHGLIVDDAVFGHVPVLATKKLVWGKANQEWYQKYGVPESRVAIVGSPRFDIITQQPWWNKTQLSLALNIDPSQKILVFATQRLYLSQVNIPIVMEGLKDVPDVFVVFLLHPSEGLSVGIYQQLVKGYSNCKVVRFGHIGLYDALSGADFFVTSHSTSAMEAMFFKLPVITVEPKPLIYSYGEAGASIRVTNAAEFNRVIKQLISDETFRNNAVKQYQSYIANNCLVDGLASQRIFDLIDQTSRTGGIA